MSQQSELEQARQFIADNYDKKVVSDAEALRLWRNFYQDDDREPERWDFQS